MENRNQRLKCCHSVLLNMFGRNIRVDPYGRCGRCHTNFARATPTFCPHFRRDYTLPTPQSSATTHQCPHTLQVASYPTPTNTHSVLPIVEGWKLSRIIGVGTIGAGGPWSLHFFNFSIHLSGLTSALLEGCLNTHTPCGFSRIARKRRRAAPPGFHLPYPPSFWQLL